MSSMSQLGDGRFNPPINPGDTFSEVKFLEGNINFSQLLIDAKESAKRSIESLRGQRGSSTTKLIFEFLLSRKYRRGPVSYIQPIQDDVMNAFEHMITSNNKIKLVISLFPCKIRQPLKTFSKYGCEIDIGEIASLLRLYEICYGIELISNCNTRFLVLCDGFRYRDCFNDAEDSIKRYQNNLCAAIMFLGIENNVTLVDESQIYSKSLFHKIDDLHFDLLKKYSINYDEEIRTTVNKLIPKIILNMDINTEKVDINEMAKFYCVLFGEYGSAHRLMSRSKRNMLFEKIFENSISKACRFIAINRVVNAAEIHKQISRHSVRCTVHPKPHQIGIHTLNKSTSIFAHCGQGVSKNRRLDTLRLQDIRVDFSANILRSPKYHYALVLNTKDFPFASNNHPFLIF